MGAASSSTTLRDAVCVMLRNVSTTGTPLWQECGVLRFRQPPRRGAAPYFARAAAVAAVLLRRIGGEHAEDGARPRLEPRRCVGRGARGCRASSRRGAAPGG